MEQLDKGEVVRIAASACNRYKMENKEGKTFE